MAGFSEINKRSNREFSWEIFLKKNKKNSILIRDLLQRSYILQSTYCLEKRKHRKFREKNRRFKIREKNVMSSYIIGVAIHFSMTAFSSLVIVITIFLMI